MFFTRLFFFTVFAVSLVFHASMSYAERAGAATVEWEEPVTYSGLFNRNGYGVRFIRRHETPNMATLRLISNGNVTGCAKMTGNEVEIKKMPPVMKIKVKDSELQLKNEEGRYGNHDCEKQFNQSYFDVLLDRDEIIKKDFKTITLTSEEYGMFMDSEVEVTEQNLKLVTQTEWGGKAVFTYWFYPTNTVILYTLQSKQGADMKDMIREFGISQGLVPLGETFKGFKVPVEFKTAYYFTDPKGGVAGRLKDAVSPPVVGQISPTRTIHGPNGPVEEPYNIDVLARHPGEAD